MVILKNYQNLDMKHWGNMRRENGKVIIDELPVGMWTDKFKEILWGFIRE